MYLKPNRNTVVEMKFKSDDGFEVIMTSRTFATKRIPVPVKLFIKFTVYCACMLNMTRHASGMNDDSVRLERTNIYLNIKFMHDGEYTVDKVSIQKISESNVLLC